MLFCELVLDIAGIPAFVPINVCTLLCLKRTSSTNYVLSVSYYVFWLTFELRSFTIVFVLLICVISGHCKNDAYCFTQSLFIHQQPSRLYAVQQLICPCMYACCSFLIVMFSTCIMSQSRTIIQAHGVCYEPVNANMPLKKKGLNLRIIYHLILICQ